MSAFVGDGPLGICDRCSFRFMRDALTPDRDSPGLIVCRRCNDEVDPWKRPFNPKDANISVPRPRPDRSIVLDVTPYVNEDGKVVDGPIPTNLDVVPSSE